MILIDTDVLLKPGRDESVRRFHPWIFSGAIARIEGTPGDGDWVRVLDQKKNILGYGHYQKGSIAVRLLSFGPEAPGEEFWIQKIKAAWELRAMLGMPSERTNTFRLIHGEGDGLPGLIADVYDGDVIMQAHSLGMYKDQHAIVRAFHAVLPDYVKRIYDKSQGTIPAKNATLTDRYITGDPGGRKIVSENQVRFYVDWEDGQKTGFFVDQRESRELLRSFAAGRTVLNTFCYTGGFSVYALEGKAKLVHSVDTSSKAIEMARDNIRLNGFDPDKHECYCNDVFDFFKAQNVQYDLIILDPPAFAKHREARHQAVKGYQRLNAEAMRRILPGGVLFTFSCSQVVDRKLFYDTLASAAIQAGRQIRVLYRLGQPADHPVSIFHPEGEYLKGFVLHVL